jgi:hypothetical protein
MPIKDKKSLAIAILAILALAVAGYYFFSSSYAPADPGNVPIDEGILQEIEDEGAITDQEDSDVNFITADDNDINEIGNSVDENEL